MANDVQVEFGAQTNALMRGISASIAGVENFGKSVGHISEKVEALGKIMIAAFATGHVVNFFREMGEYGDQALIAAQRLGVTVEMITRLSLAAKLSGVDNETLSRNLEHLARAAADASKGGNIQLAAFQALGVKVTDTAGKLRPLSDLFEDVAEASSKTADGIRKTDAMAVLFGRTGGKFIAVLNEGKKGLHEFGEEAEHLGLAISGETAKKLDEMGDNIDKMLSAFKGLGIAVAELFSPVINDITRFVTWFVSGITTIIRWVDQLLYKLDALTAHKLFGMAPSTDGAKPEEKKKEVPELREPLGNMEQLQEQLLKLKMAQQDILADTTVLERNFWAEKRNNANLTAKEQMTIDASLFELRKRILADGLAEDQNYLDQKAVGARYDNDLQRSILNQRTAMMKYYYGEDSREYRALIVEKLQMEQRFADETRRIEIARLQNRLAVQKMEIDDERAAIQEQINVVSWGSGEKFARLRELRDKEYLLEYEALQDQLMLGELSLEARADIEHKMTELQGRRIADMHELDRRALDASYRDWESFFGSIVNSWSSAIMGLINGTMTWEEAWRSSLTNMLNAFVQTLLEMFARWLAIKAAMMAIDFFTLGSGSAAASAGSGFASLANGGGNQMFSFDKGAWEIPRDMTAKIHEGETVLPKDMAEQFRAGQLGGGGGGTVNFNVTALDARSVRTFFDQHAGSLAKSISGHMELNPSQRPRY